MFRDLDNEKLRRQEGVVAEDNVGVEEGCASSGECAPDDDTSEPFAFGGLPGTVDDIPIDLGEEEPSPVDQQFDLAGEPTFPGSTIEAAEGDEAPELGALDARDMWRRQRPLIEEHELNAVRLDGFPDEVIPSIMDAMGDEVAEPLPDSPNGVSATGSVSEPEHGGFPPREE